MMIFPVLLLGALSLVDSEGSAGETQTTVQFTILDQRPPEEDKGKLLSMMPTSCAFSISRLSDKGMTRSRMESLRNALQNSGLTRLAGSTVIVRHYVLHLNESTADGNGLRRAGAAAVAASSGFASYERQTTVSPKCPKDQTPAGWFDPAEVSNNRSPLIADLEIELNGRNIRIHQVLSPDIELGYARADVQAIYKDRLIEKVQNELINTISMTL